MHHLLLKQDHYVVSELIFVDSCMHLLYITSCNYYYSINIARPTVILEGHGGGRGDAAVFI